MHKYSHEKILGLILQVHKDGFKERIGGTGNKSETPSAWLIALLVHDLS